MPCPMKISCSARVSEREIFVFVVSAAQAANSWSWALPLGPWEADANNKSLSRMPAMRGIPCRTRRSFGFSATFLSSFRATRPQLSKVWYRPNAGVPEPVSPCWLGEVKKKNSKKGSHKRVLARRWEAPSARWLAAAHRGGGREKSLSRGERHTHPLPSQHQSPEPCPIPLLSTKSCWYCLSLCSLSLLS